MEQKTHFQLLQYVRDYRPADDHVTSKEEIERIAKHFGLEKMPLMELRNLRDMTVLYFSYMSAKEKLNGNREDASDAIRSMQSITSIFDIYISRKGAEV